jgi:carboxymethylenebutenolidase
VPDIDVPFFCSLPSSPPPWPGVVVVMEGDGMKPQLLRVCERLAAEGYAVGAPDLYWRFGGSNPEAGGNPYGELRHSDGLADIRAVADRLRGFGATALGITGFCMGGGYAYMAATRDAGFAAAAPFYGGGIAQHLGEAGCPLLCFFGGTDEWIGRDDIAAVEAHHPDRVVVYEDAGHGFMRDGSPSFDDAAAADAWGRLLAFFGDHLRAS